MPLAIRISAEASALGRPVMIAGAAVGGELAVARERLHEEERDDVDDERDEDQHHRARVVVVVAVAAAAEQEAELDDVGGDRGEEAASVITSTSRLPTWVSSWAMTPSSSAGESSSMIPVVAHTVADFGQRPSANAFGMRCRRPRPSAWAGRPGRRGARSSRAAPAPPAGVTSRRAHGAQRELVAAEQLHGGEAAGDDRDGDAVGAAREQRADEHDVEQRRGGRRRRPSGPGVRCPCRMWKSEPCVLTKYKRSVRRSLKVRGRLGSGA